MHSPYQVVLSLSLSSPPPVKKLVNLHPLESPQINFVHPFHKSLTTDYRYLKWNIKLLNFYWDIKIFNNKMSQFSQEILKNVLPVLHIFTRTYNSWPWYSAANRKLLVSPLKFWKSILQFVVFVKAYHRP